MTEPIPFDVSYDFDEQLWEVPRNPSAIQKALDWLTTRLAEAELDAVQRIRYYSRIGVYARMLHQYETAIDALQTALSQATQQQHERLVLVNQIRLAHVYQWQGRYDESNALFDQIIQTCETNPRVADYLDFAYQHAGKNAFDQAEYATATRYFEQALALRKAQGNAELVESTELALSLTQQRMQKGTTMTHSEVQIRQANDTDLTAIVELNYGLFQEDAGQRDPSMNTEWPRQHGMEYFRDMLTGTKSICFVAITDAETVGYLVGYVREPNDLHLTKSAELESMFVLPMCRSQQVGRQLVQTFLAWARECGAQSISVSAYAANERAVAFYQSHGFKPKNLILETDIEMP